MVKVKFWKYGKEAIYAGGIHGVSHFIGESFLGLTVLNNIYFAGTVVAVWVGYRFFVLLVNKRR